MFNIQKFLGVDEDKLYFDNEMAEKIIVPNTNKIFGYEKIGEKLFDFINKKIINDKKDILNRYNHCPW